MRLHTHSTGISERRLARLEAMPPSAPGEMQLSEQLELDVRTLNERIEKVLAEVQRTGNVTLSPDRRQAVERQQKLIADKLRFIGQNADKTASALNAERAQLLSEVDGLLSYARFQADQQRENEGVDGRHRWGELGGVTMENDPAGRPRIWIRADRDALLQMSYVSRNPQVSRLLGAISFDRNTVSTTMPGTFTAERWNDPRDGTHYFLVTPDETFDGTFTFYINGMRRSVDYQSRQARADAAAVRPRPGPVPVAPPVLEGANPVDAEADRYRTLLTQLDTATEGLANALRDNNDEAANKYRAELQKINAEMLATRTRILNIYKKLNLPLTDLPEVRVQNDAQGRETYLSLLRINGFSYGEWYSAARNTVANPIPGSDYLLRHDQMYRRVTGPGGALQAYRYERGDPARAASWTPVPTADWMRAEAK